MDPKKFLSVAALAAALAFSPSALWAEGAGDPKVPAEPMKQPPKPAAATPAVPLNAAGPRVGAGVFVAQPIDIDGDARLRALAAALPKNWKITSSTSEIFIERDGMVKVIFDNRINTPAAMEAEKKPVADLPGRESKCGFVLRCEPKWGAVKKAELERSNAAIYKQIDALEEKHKVKELKVRMLNAKGGADFAAKTPEEKKRVEAFTAERAVLLEKIQRPPEYQAEGMSLRLVSQHGLETDMDRVVPPEASAEAYKVLELMRDALKK